MTNDLLRRALALPRRERYFLELRGWEAVEQPPSWSGNAPTCVDLLDRDKLFDVMNGR